MENFQEWQWCLETEGTRRYEPWLEDHNSADVIDALDGEPNTRLEVVVWLTDEYGDQSIRDHALVTKGTVPAFTVGGNEIPHFVHKELLDFAGN